MALLVCLLLAYGQATAHGIRLFAYPEGGKLVGEGYFSGGKKAMNCPVLLKDKNGKLLLEGKTDHEGRFSLPIPQTEPPFLLILKAGEGHRAEYRLTAADMGADKSKTASKPEPPKAPAGKAPKISAGPKTVAGPEMAALVEKAVAKAMSASLKGVNARLDRLAEGKEPGAKDIIGGLGWIMGLVGIAAYFKAREKRKG